MQRVHPDDTDNVEQSGEELGDGAGGGVHQFLTRPIQERDKLQTILSFFMTFLQHITIIVCILDL